MKISGAPSSVLHIFGQIWFKKMLKAINCSIWMWETRRNEYFWFIEFKLSMKFHPSSGELQLYLAIFTFSLKIDKVVNVQTIANNFAPIETVNCNTSVNSASVFRRDVRESCIFSFSNYLIKSMEINWTQSKHCCQSNKNGNEIDTFKCNWNFGRFKRENFKEKMKSLICMAFCSLLILPTFR